LRSKPVTRIPARLGIAWSRVDVASWRALPRRCCLLSRPAAARRHAVGRTENWVKMRMQASASAH